MDETENKEVQQNGEEGKKERSWFLIFLACLLSVGSLGWTTFSLLDFFQPGGLDLAHINWREISPMGLSVAGTADVAWSLTIVAQFRGVRVMIPKWWGKDEKDEKREPEKFDLVPLLSWIEVLFVAGLLFKHGQTMDNGSASFAAALPILTKIGWMLAIADMKDPSDLTPEEKEALAVQRREARRLREKTLADQDRHDAELLIERRKGEAVLERERLAGELAKERKRNDFELRKMDQQTEYEMKKLDGRLKAELQLGLLESRQEVMAMQDEFEWNATLRRPRTISGHVISAPGSRMEITDGGEYGSEFPDLASAGLKPSEQKRAHLAREFYAVRAEQGSAVTKAAFAVAQRTQPPRVTEATQAYPVEWFVERGLATWMTHQN